MNCIRAKKAVQSYIDGYLPVEREEALFAHLDRCPACRQYYDDIVLIYDAMEETEREAPFGFRAAWQDEIAAIGQKKKIINFKVAVPVFAACVCCLLVTSAVVLGANNNLFHAEAEVPVVVSQEAKDTFEIEQLDDGIQPPPAQTSSHATAGNGMLREDTTTQESGDVPGEVQSTVIQSNTVTPSVSPQVTATQSPVPATAQGGNVSALSSPVIIHATGKPFRQELIDFAKGNGVAVTENETGSVTLQADTAALNLVLANFQLEPVIAGAGVIEIIF